MTAPRTNSGCPTVRPGPTANPPADVTTPGEPDGYLLGSTNPEIERLLHQAALLDREMTSLLDDLGSLRGAAAVDIGCGPRGILPALADRVGPTGRVVGIDRDPVMIAHAATFCSELGLTNLDVLCGDACSTGLPAATFDLAHIRLLLVNTAEPEAVVREAARLVRPGGLLAIQEVDWLSWHCEPPHPAWDTLRDLLHRLWASRGFDPCIGRRLPMLLRGAGIRQVQARAHAGIDPHDEPYGHLLVTWAQRFEPQLVEAGITDPPQLHQLATTLESHLNNPDTIVIRAATIQAWGHTPA